MFSDRSKGGLPSVPPSLPSSFVSGEDPSCSTVTNAVWPKVTPKPKGVPAPFCLSTQVLPVSPQCFLHRTSRRVIRAVYKVTMRLIAIGVPVELDRTLSATSTECQAAPQAWLLSTPRSGQPGFWSARTAHPHRQGPGNMRGTSRRCHSCVQFHLDMTLWSR